MAPFLRSSRDGRDAITEPTAASVTERGRPCTSHHGTFRVFMRWQGREALGNVADGEVDVVGHRRKSWSVLVAGVVVLAAVIALGADARAVSPAVVDIKDSKYLPPTLTVAVGTTVRWTNRDEESHTVTFDTERAGSAGLERNEDYTHTFTKAGVYPYTCCLHPFMQGTIVVN